MLAIGATGQFAGLVVPALVSRGVQVRALVRDPAKHDRVRDAGADQAVVGDLRDPASVRAALDGVDGVFLIIPAFAPDSAALDTGVVAAARYHSDLEFTILQPAMFMQGLLGGWQSAVEHGCS